MKMKQILGADGRTYDVIDTSFPSRVTRTDEPTHFCPSYPDRCAGCETVTCSTHGCDAPAVYRAAFTLYDSDEFFCAAHVPAEYRAVAEEE